MKNDTIVNNTELIMQSLIGWLPYASIVELLRVGRAETTVSLTCCHRCFCFVCFLTFIKNDNRIIKCNVWLNDNISYQILLWNIKTSIFSHHTWASLILRCAWLQVMNFLKYEIINNVIVKGYEKEVFVKRNKYNAPLLYNILAYYIALYHITNVVFNRIIYTSFLWLREFIK